MKDVGPGFFPPIPFNDDPWKPALIENKFKTE
jgi:hypothetical protein